VGSGALPLGRAARYCWFGSGEHPLLVSQFRIHFEDLDGGQTTLRVVPVNPVVLKNAGWLESIGSRYRFTEVSVTADLEASVIAEALRQCTGGTLRGPRPRAPTGAEVSLACSPQ
jgi:hypothetical protein